MDDNKEIQNKIVSGLFWKFGERIIAQGIAFIISLVLARILLPEQYGTVSLVLVFINIANVFVSDGLGAALIQKKDSDEVDFSTMFFCSIGLAAVLYFILYFGAPVIARFYENQELTRLVRVLSLQIPLASVKTIQHAYVSKHMMFKRFFWSTLGGTVISGGIGIIMAYNGFGVWALVEQYLVNSIIDMSVLFVTVRWRPHLLFSKESAKSLLSYSWKLLIAQLINTLYSECRSLIIGKVYTEADLAFTNKGNQFPYLLINNLNTTISAVLFPAMSMVNNDVARVKDMTRKSMRLSSYVIFPSMIGMIAIAEPMIRIMLTDKWLPCIPFLRLWCLYWMLQPCQTANVQAMKAVGRSDICLRLEIIKKIIGVGLTISTMFISVKALIVSNTFVAFISAMINIYPNRKLIKYGYKEQIGDLFPILVLSIVMGAIVYFLNFAPIADIIKIFLQVVLGIFLYAAGSMICGVDCYKNVLSVVEGLRRKQYNS